MHISFIKERTGENIELSQFIRENSLDIHSPAALDMLMDAIGNARYVLLGEASHGTHEYYTWRARISKRLIREKNFSMIAVEGDWPDCYQLNRYIRQYKDSADQAKTALSAFNRWPTWMWANWEMVEFAEWLRHHNANLPQNSRVGFYGLDVYSLWESLHAILGYLEKEDPATRDLAMEAWRCFEPYIAHGGQAYGSATQQPLVPVSCEGEVIDLLMRIREKMQQYDQDPEAVINAEQNAMVAVNAERYYRSMMRGGPEAWNIRDHHMADTLNRLIQHQGIHSKAIIWAHNTHIGDARATDMRYDGMVNIGQILNEQHDHEGVFSVGFGSFEGRVIAGRNWGDVIRSMQLPRAKPDSWEYILHQADAKDRLMLMSDPIKDTLGTREIDHRAVGVVYNPQWEYGNYVPSLIAYRYDAFIYLDQTKALHPLHLIPDGHQTPETYPFGI